MSTQNMHISTHLRSGKAITADEAKQMYGISRLSARINELKTLGMIIQSEMIEVPSRGGKTARVKKYWVKRTKWDDIHNRSCIGCGMSLFYSSPIRHSNKMICDCGKVNV